MFEIWNLWQGEAVERKLKAGTTIYGASKMRHLVESSRPHFFSMFLSVEELICKINNVPTLKILKNGACTCSSQK